MLDSSLIIRNYLEAVSREEFMNDMEKQDAILRRFEIIGESQPAFDSLTSQGERLG